MPTWLDAGPGQKLAEGDDVGVGAIVDPSPPGHEFLAEIAEMGDRTAERGEAEPQKDREDLGPGPGRAAGGRRRITLHGLGHRLPVQFVDEFPDLRPGDSQRVTPLARRPIVAARAPAGAFGPGFQVTLALEAMQHGVERSRPDPVAVLPQLLDHPVAEELAFRRMMQDVQANQPAEEFLMPCRRHAHAATVVEIRNRFSILRPGPWAGNSVPGGSRPLSCAAPPRS